jgi:hypothetical protein
MTITGLYEVKFKQPEPVLISELQGLLRVRVTPAVDLSSRVGNKPVTPLKHLYYLLQELWRICPRQQIASLQAVIFLLSEN